MKVYLRFVCNNSIIIVVTAVYICIYINISTTRGYLLLVELLWWLFRYTHSRPAPLALINDSLPRRQI